MSLVELLRKNDAESLSILKKTLQQKSDSSDVLVDDQFVAELSESLRPRLQSLNWMESAPYSKPFCLLLEIAVMAFKQYTGDGLPLMASLGAYLNPHVPWSNTEFSAISSSIDVAKCQKLQSSFLAYLQPRMAISTEPQLRSVKSSSSRYSKMKGLRPALGFSPSTSSREQERQAWKTSSNVLSLSEVLLLLLMNGKESPMSGICASFILQVFEDSDPLFKIQALFLLRKFLESNDQYLVSSGLIRLFKDELKVCLTYLPQLTPANVSMRLMKSAYPCLCRIVDLEIEAGVFSDSYTPYVEIIVSHLMGSISHVSRSKERETNELLAFFLQEISKLIDNRVGISILVCLSRLFFTLNQLITDPFIIDFDAGTLVVDAALQVQLTVLELFKKTADSEGSAMVLAYKYDLLACWAVLAKRITSFGVGTSDSRRFIQQNLGLLHDLSLAVPNAAVQFEKDKAQMLEKVPEMVGLLAN